MYLYILRHGIAEDYRPDLPDSQRRLTDEGIAGMEAEAEAMKVLDIELDHLYSSPYLRARETAEIVQSALSIPELHLTDELISGQVRLGSLQTLFANLPSSSRIMIVGHEPDLSGLIHTLTGASAEMKKGGLACIETNRLEPDSGLLRWLLTPKALRLIGD